MTQCRWTTRLTQSKVHTVVGWSQKGFNLGNVVKLGGQFFLNFLKEFFALGQLEYYRSVNLESNLWSANFSQKMNERICFSILTTRKYLKLEIEIQVSSISESSGQKNKFVCSFFGRSFGSTILFRDLLTFNGGGTLKFNSITFKNIYMY